MQASVVGDGTTKKKLKITMLINTEEGLSLVYVKSR